MRSVPACAIRHCTCSRSRCCNPRCERVKGPWGGQGRPADYLPPGTVGQWVPVPCNGGPCARAATQKPTKQPRGLTQNSRAGNPKRTRPKLPPVRVLSNHRGLQRTKRGGGPKTPLCNGKGPEDPGVVAPFAVADCRGNRMRAVVRRLGKFDLRPCPLRLRSSLLVLGCTGFF